MTAYHLHYCLCDGEHCRVKYKVAAWVSLAKIAPSNGLQRDKKNSATTTSSAPAAALIVMKAAYEGVNPYRPAVKHPKVLLSIPINPIRPFHPIHLICPTRPIGPIRPICPIRSSDSFLHSPHISLLSHSEGESLRKGEKKRLGRRRSPQNGRFGGRATSCECSEEQTIDQARILGRPDNSLL